MADGDGFEAGYDDTDDDGDDAWEVVAAAVRSEATAELRRSGPLALGELASRLRGQGIELPELDGLDDEDWEDLVDQSLLATDDIWSGDDDVVWLVEELLGSVVLTRRLSADELSRQAVDLTPDLGTLVWIPHDDGVSLACGGTVRVTYAGDGEERAAEGGSLVGPAGWLSGIEPDGLCSLRWAKAELVVEPVGPSSLDEAASARRVAGLRRLFDERYETGVAVEVDGLAMEAIAADRAAWTAPAAPVQELLASAGLEVRGDWVGPAGEAWDPPGVVAAREHKRAVTKRLGLDRCCLAALEEVERAWRASGADGLPMRRTTVGDQAIDWRSVARALGHGSVAQAFLEVRFSFAGVVEFCAPMIRLGGRLSAPALFLTAMALELEGATLEAEAHLKLATLEDPEFAPALAHLAWYATDRGDVVEAASLLRRAGAVPGDRLLTLLEDRLADSPTAGRNERCPCGSGRKFKACCQRTPRLDLNSRVTWLYQRLAFFSTRPPRLEAIQALHRVAMLRARPEAEDALLAFLVDILIFEGGCADEFRQLRGMLLPGDEAALLASWEGSRLELWEVSEVEPGRQFRLRDTSSGETLLVTERSGSRNAKVGDYLLARVVPVVDQHQIIGPVLNIELHHRPSLIELLDSEPDALDLALWLGRAFAPPHMQTREGEDMVLCNATFDPVDLPLAELEKALDGTFTRDDDGWIWTTELPNGESVIRAFLRRDDEGLLSLQTNSMERYERLSALLGEIAPDLELVGKETQTIEEAVARASQDGGGGGAPTPAELPPGALEAVTELMQQMERRWVDESIPALGGLTPRQAVGDPTRREDLDRLLGD